MNCTHTAVTSFTDCVTASTDCKTAITDCVTAFTDCILLHVCCLCVGVQGDGSSSDESDSHEEEDTSDTEGHAGAYLYNLPQITCVFISNVDQLQMCVFLTLNKRF